MTEHVSLGAFEFDCGESVPDLDLAYETYGEFDGDGVGRSSTSDRAAPESNAVLVCHALTGSQHVASVGRTPTDRQEAGTPRGGGAGTPRGGGAGTPRGGGGAGGTSAGRPIAGQAAAWWDDIVGPGKAIDTNDYYVVCANVPGSCYGSSGPPSEGPDGEPWGTDFPAVTVADWTRAQRRLLDHLGVPHLHAVTGGSVGGMNVLDWAKRHPDHVDRVIPIAAGARLDPQCLALDAIARRCITTDPDWQGGDYYDTDGESPGGNHPTHGLALARQIGHVMYLSKSSMADKFGRRSAGMDAARDAFPADPAAGFFPYREVESYLDYNGERFAERFDANSYLYLTRAMDGFDLASGHESDADALAAFDGEAMVLSFSGDWHFTVEQGEHLAEAFRTAGADTAHHVVDSDHGHDAFLVEPDLVGPPLADFLDDGVQGRAVTDTREEDEASEFAPVHTSLFSD